MDSGTVGNVTSPGQVAITQETYNAIVVAQLTELWTRYGSLGEIWFDVSCYSLLHPRSQPCHQQPDTHGHHS